MGIRVVGKACRARVLGPSRCVHGKSHAGADADARTLTPALNTPWHPFTWYTHADTCRTPSPCAALRLPAPQPAVLHGPAGTDSYWTPDALWLLVLLLLPPQEFSMDMLLLTLTGLPTPYAVVLRLLLLPPRSSPWTCW